MELDREDVWELVHGLYTSAHQVQRGVQQQPTDPMMLRLLAMVEDHGSVRPSDVAERLDVSPPTVSRYVRQLQADDRIAVLPDPGDGRSYLIEITDAGAGFVRQFKDRMVDVFTDMLSGWRPDEVHTLARLLTRLNTTAAAAMDDTRPARIDGKNWWKGGG